MAATTAAPWSTDETRALFDAWQGTLDVPTHQRDRFKVHMFQLFLAECGGKTERTESSVSSQYAALKNMGHLVMGFSNKPKWFALALEQKLRWFKMVNRRTYKFIDLDEPAFQRIEALIKQQRDGVVRNPSNLRVPLRRHGVLGFWEVHRSLAEKRAEAAALVAQLSSRIDATPHSSSSMRAELPMPPVMFHQFLHSKPSQQRGSGIPERSASEGAAKAVSRASLLHQFVSPSSVHRDDIIMVDGGAYDSGSSTESDSEIEGWQEPRLVALLDMQPDAVHIKQDPTASVDSLNDAASNVSSFLSVTPQPGSLADLESKLLSYGRPNAAFRSISRNSAQSTRNVQRKAPTSSAHAKNQNVDPELLMVSSILEKQAQQLKEILAHAKKELAFDLQIRQRDQELSSRNQEMIEQYIQQVNADKENRQDDQDRRAKAQAERTKILKQIQLDHEERVKYQEERRREQEQRTQLLERMQMETTERQQEREQRKLEQEQRRLVLEQIKHDRQEQEQAREVRRKHFEQIQLEKEKRDVPPVAGIKLVNTVAEEDKENTGQQNVEQIASDQQQHRKRTTERTQLSKQARRVDPNVRGGVVWEVENKVGTKAKRLKREFLKCRELVADTIKVIDQATQLTAAKKQAVEAVTSPITAKKRAVEAPKAKAKKRVVEIATQRNTSKKQTVKAATQPSAIKKKTVKATTQSSAKTKKQTAKAATQPSTKVKKRSLEVAAQPSAAKKQAIESATQSSSKTKKRAVEPDTHSNETKKQKPQIESFKKRKVAAKEGPKTNGAIKALKSQGTKSWKSKNK